MIALAAVVVGALLIGLPLLAVATARRLPEPTARAVRGDAFWQVGRDFGLRGSDYVLVESAVLRGEAVPARLQPAAHAMAQVMMRQWPLTTSRRQRKVALVLVAAFAVILLTAAAVTRKPILFVDIAAVVPGVLVNRRQFRQRRAAALRALELNQPDVTGRETGEMTLRRNACPNGDR